MTDLNNWDVALDDMVRRLDEIERRENELKNELKAVTEQKATERGNILAHLQEAGVPSQDHELATLSVKRGSMSVQVAAPDALPPKYTRTKVEPDTKKISDALKEGLSVLGASFERGPDSIAIKWRKDNG